MNKTTRKHWAKCTTGGGFTLAELLIVVAVIAVLVAVAIPTFGNQLERSRQAVDLSNLRDAYAVGQMAVLSSDEPEGILQTTNSTNTAERYYRFWYTPDNEEQLTAAGEVAETPTADAVKGKATTAKLAVKTDGGTYPKQIVYSGDTIRYCYFCQIPASSESTHIDATYTF